MPMRGQGHLAGPVPLEIGEPEPRRGALQIAQRQRRSRRSETRRARRRLAAARSPASPPAPGRSGSTIEPVGRCVEIGAQVQPAADDLAVEGRRQILRPPAPSGVPAAQVLQVEVGLVERAGDADHAASGRRETGSTPGQCSFSAGRKTSRSPADRRPAGGRTRSGGSAPRLRAPRPARDSGCSRTRAVGEPGQIRRARPRDPIGQRRARVDLQHVEHALLAAVLREPVGQQAPVLAGIEPVERGRALGIERVGVDQDAVLAVDALAHVQHRLVLPAVPPLVEVAAGHRLRRARARRSRAARPAGRGCGPGLAPRARSDSVSAFWLAVHAWVRGCSPSSSQR